MVDVSICSTGTSVCATGTSREHIVKSVSAPEILMYQEIICKYLTHVWVQLWIHQSLHLSCHYLIIIRNTAFAHRDWLYH